MAQSNQSQSVLRIDSITSVGWIAVVTALISGVIHLYLAPNVINFSQTMGILFYIAGAGYLIGIAWFLTNYWNRYLYVVAAVLTAVQIVMWVNSGMNNMTFGAPDKIAQIIFIGAALYLFKQES